MARSKATKEALDRLEELCSSGGRLDGVTGNSRDAEKGKAVKALAAALAQQKAAALEKKK